MSEKTGDSQTGESRFSFRNILSSILKIFGYRLLAGLISAVSGLIIFYWLAEEVFEGDTKAFDENIRQAVHQTAAPLLTSLMKFFSLLGSTAFLVPLGALAIAAFIYLRHSRACVLFCITMAGELILDLSLKTLYGRSRPEPFFDYPLPNSYSFPSGHALGSFCFYIILAWLVTDRLENLTVKILIWAAAILLVLCIGLSRIYLGVHYPSDVLAGYSAALCWTLIVGITDSQLRKKPIPDTA